MKHLTIYLLCFFASTGFAQKSLRSTLNKELELLNKPSQKSVLHTQNDLDRKINRFGWDDVNSTWILNGISEMKYAQNGSLEELIEYDSNGQAYSKLNFYSNAGGMITGVITSKFNNSTWVFESKSEQEVDSKGEKIRDENYSWENNQWILSFGIKSIVEKTSPSQEITTQLEYNVSVKSYQPVRRSISNFNGTLLEETIFQTFQSNSWVNESAEGYDYNGNGQINSILYLTWDGQMFQNKEIYSDIIWHNYEKKQFSEMVLRVWDGTQWKYDQKAVYQYSLNFVLVGITYTWKDFQWVYQYRISEEFDQLNNPKKFKVENYSGNDWNVLMETRTEYTYDNNNRLVESISQIKEGNNWINVQREVIDYSKSTGIESTKLSMKVFPNPCTDYIQLEVKEYAIDIARVIDLSGKVVLEERNLNAEFDKINTSQLINGYYIIEVVQSGSVVREKFLKK